MNKQKRRLQRQIKILGNKVPRLERPIHIVLNDRTAMWRVPLAIAFILSGLLFFLPVLGLWMLPLGFLILALDVQLLQGPVSACVIRSRRRLRLWRRRRGRGRSRAS